MYYRSRYNTNMEKVRRFVVQKHTRAGQVHWDIMLEAADILETWRLGLPPEKLQGRSGQSAQAVKIFDHPLKFLTYEGSVNKGEGSVETADRGTYLLLNEDDDTKLLQLKGKILNGKFALEHVEEDKWNFTPKVPAD